MNMINITNQPGMIDVFDADTNELLFVMGAEDMKRRADAVDADHRRQVIKSYATGWSEHRVKAAKDSRMLVFVGKSMPEKTAKSLAREIDKFSKSKA